MDPAATAAPKAAHVLQCALHERPPTGGNVPRRSSSRSARSMRSRTLERIGSPATTLATLRGSQAASTATVRRSCASSFRGAVPGILPSVAHAAPSMARDASMASPQASHSARPCKGDSERVSAWSGTTRDRRVARIRLADARGGLSGASVDLSVHLSVSSLRGMHGWHFGAVSRRRNVQRLRDACSA